MSGDYEFRITFCCIGIAFAILLFSIAYAIYTFSASCKLNTQTLEKRIESLEQIK